MNLIVWGTGDDYIKNRKHLKIFDYRLVDSDPQKQGKVFDGIKVENPDILNHCQYDFIIVATIRYYDDVYAQLTEKYSISKKKILSIRDVRSINKEILMREIGGYKLEKCKEPKILFGYCFLIYENCRLHDYLLAESLRLRGAEVVPVACGGAQELECSVYGGMWGNNADDRDEKKIIHKGNCKKCRAYDERVWEDWGNYTVTYANDYITVKERNFAKDFVKGLDINSIQDWTYNGFPIGKWCLRTHYNNYLISYKTVWTQVEEKQIRDLAFNVVIMCIASMAVVEDIKPDIIYSNDSFYYPYSILEEIAKREDIPFYNAYGFRKGTYTYAMNASTLSMENLGSAWRGFSKFELNDEESKFIADYISNRRKGGDMLINTADPFQSVKQIRDDSIHGIFDKEKKTALMATNITWDASALDRDIVFDNIVDWVLFTIDWFANNSEWQLIIRTHPAEINKNLPEARERICSIVLREYNDKLPSNIILIDGDAPLSIYDLFDNTDLGLVYTSTVGLEMCCNSIPTIVVADAPYRGKGFSYDVSNVKEYKETLNMLTKITLNSEQKKKMKNEAEKFFLLYYFVYMLPNPFYKFTYEAGAKMIMRGPEDLLAGNNQVWDYICESILEKKAVISEERIPPYKLKV
ncbi:MAG: hypothetical protein HDR16_08420 [Lachnospiraceae bacterium]|nr:hypothetical protein [Lachnospiraceae bacterium]